MNRGVCGSWVQGILIVCDRSRGEGVTQLTHAFGFTGVRSPHSLDFSITHALAEGDGASVQRLWSVYATGKSTRVFALIRLNFAIKVSVLSSSPRSIASLICFRSTCIALGAGLGLRVWRVLLAAVLR